MSSGKIVVLGSSNVDHVMRVQRFPQPGETLSGQSYALIPGGKGANQAVACARLGAETVFLSAVGDDVAGAGLIAGFEEDGIDCRGIERVPGQPTGVAMIFVSDDAENMIGVAAGANACVDAGFVGRHADLLRSADLLLMQLETPDDGIEAAARVAREAGVQVVLNPAPARPLSDSLLGMLDMLTPNQTEAELLTGQPVNDEAGAAAAAAVLHGKGVPRVIITLGGQGAWVSERGQDGYRVPAQKVTPVDTTAAGDTFNGGLVVGLSEGMSLQAAVSLGAQAAAISVTRPGAQTSVPWRADLPDA